MEPRGALGPSAQRHRLRRKGWILRFIGKTCLAGAFVVASYIAWLLWGTSLYTAQQQETLREEIHTRIERGGREPASRSPTVPGHAYAVIRIPDVGVNAVAVEGTDLESLKRGPGHYEDTANPWQQGGRVAIAGHRTTYGAWFWDLNELETGDAIVLRHERGTTRYRVTATEILTPTAENASRVLRQTTRPTLVLTTCHPRGSAAYRLVVFAERVEPEKQRATAAPPPPAASSTVPRVPALEQARALLIWVGLVVALAVLAAIVLAAARRRRPAPSAARDLRSPSTPYSADAR
jgi:sortase A